MAHGRPARRKAFVDLITLMLRVATRVLGWGWAMAAATGLLVSASGCAHSPGPVMVEPTGPASAPFFWELSLGDRTSYLLGTIHIGVGLDELPPSILNKLDQSNALVTETALPARGEQSQAETIPLSETLLPPGQSLKEMLSPTAWEKFKKLVKPAVYEGKLRILTPLAATALVNLARSRNIWRDYQSSLAGKPVPLMDLELVRYAQARARKLETLETLEESTPQGLTEPTVASLEQLLSKSEPVHPGDALWKVIDQYRRGRLEEFEALDSANTAAVNEAVFEKRNEHWVPEILKFHKSEGPVFIAVGIGHMADPAYSLLKLLKDAGFTVRRFN